MFRYPLVPFAGDVEIEQFQGIVRTARPGLERRDGVAHILAPLL